MPKINVCCGNNCSRTGNPERLEETLKAAGFTDVEMCGCTGFCERGPNVVADDKIYHEAKPRDIVERIIRNEGITLRKISIDDLKLDDDLL